MAADKDSAGQIGLDLVINQKDFNRQLKGIQSLAKKAGAAMASAFAVKKLVDFGKECIALGSDLQEVQNVVDVTFPRMSKQVDEFAKNAASQFGLSEIMAKRFTGTFGAMAKAFGFNEQAAYEMGTALTGLAGDVASFYNISQDEAYTKLKSVFTGETESLKDLGVVMTQTALDSFALANGYGKTTAAMSEAEKVALRYAFVQRQLNAAAGDFSRTADGWANQVRVLNLQFDTLKGTIGQGLINVFTPILEVINSVIGKLQTLANAFLAVTNLFAGKKQKSGGMGAVAQDAEAAADAVGGVGEAAQGAAGAAKKAAKDMAKAFSIDELNIVTPESESGGSGGGAGGTAGMDMTMEPVPVDTTALDTYDSKLQDVINRVKELQSLFLAGFRISFGDFKVLDSIRLNLTGIKEELIGIASDSKVQSAFHDMLNQIALNAGKVAGSVASIGATLADNLTGGIYEYLEQNSGRIKEFLVSIFDLGAENAVIVGRFSEMLADIAEIFRSDSAKQITADIIGIFFDPFMGITELAGKFCTDIADLLTRPFIDNRDKIKEALQGTLDIISQVLSDIKQTIDFTSGKLNETYDEKIAPMFEVLGTGISEAVGLLVSGFQEYILPVIQEAADKFSTLNTEHIQPLIEAFLEFAGKVSEAITALWQNILQPFITWFLENIFPVISEVLSLAIDTFFSFLEGVSEVLGSVIEALSGLIDFLTGVFTGDWKKAWNGIKQFVTNIWNAIKSMIELVFNSIAEFISATLQSVNTIWSTVWTAIKDFASSIWETIKTTISNLIDSIRQKITTVMDGIKTGISTALENIKKAWSDTWENLKQKTSEIFEGIWGTIKGIINKIIGGVEKMANNVVKAINKMISAVNEVADHIPGVDEELIPPIGELHLPRLAQGGFVKANTPRLAVIGDNKREGEIVSPESKLLSMAQMAAQMASNGNGNIEHLERIIELLERIIDLIERLDLVVNVDIREIHKKLKDLDKRAGYKLRTT